MSFFRHAFVAASLLIQPALAQESAAPKPAAPEDEVVVTADPFGTLPDVKLRNAFAAFRTGNYALAETRFNVLATSVRVYLEFTPVKTGEFNIREESQGRAVLNYMAGISAARQGEFKRAVAALRRALDLDPNYQDARVDLATILVLAGDLDKAEPHLGRLQKAIDRCKRECDVLEGRFARLEATYEKAAAKP